MASVLADLIVVVHLAFVVFVVAGGFLLGRWPRLLWLHLPAAVWGAYIEFSGGDAYSGDFVEHYLLPLLYPAQLTPGLQVWLGFGVVAVNAAAYVLAWRAWHRRYAAGRRGAG